MHGEREVEGGDEAHGREVADGIVGQLREDDGVDDHRRDGREEQRAAVGGGIDDGLGADLPAGAGAGLDDGRLAEGTAHLVGDDAGQRVTGAARGEGEDEAEGAGLGAQRRSGEREGSGGAEKRPTIQRPAIHDDLPLPLYRPSDDGEDPSARPPPCQ